MKDKKKIIFSFDYELFLGRKSGTVEECLIAPTEKIHQILNSYGIKGIFFVDTAYLLSLKEVSLRDPLAERDLGLVISQLRELVKGGHYIFPHLHPHWMDALYLLKTREWELNNLSKYRFHSLNSGQRQQLFNASVGIINEIVSPVNSGYLINAYRAGGWSIEPFDDFRPFFDKFGIKYDFSVLPGLSEFSENRRFDYSNVIHNGIYRFNDFVSCINENGNFTEFCISVLRINSVVKLFNRIYLKAVRLTAINENFSKGEGIPSCEPDNCLETASVELMTSVKLPLYFDFLKKNDYMQLASHPKMILRHNLSAWVKFLDGIHNKYLVETDFLRMI